MTELSKLAKGATIDKVWTTRLAKQVLSALWRDICIMSLGHIAGHSSYEMPIIREASRQSHEQAKTADPAGISSRAWQGQAAWAS